jgi:glucose/arabinose dehydrogenase
MKNWLFILLLSISSIVFSQLPENYSSQLIQDNYNTIMGTIFNSDGTKMFAWEQAGKIYVSNWNGSVYIKQSNPVLDISDEVSGYRDFGLLSIALDPNFEVNGYIYLFYTVDRHHLLYYGTPNYDSNTNDYFKASISRLTRYKLNHLDNPMTTDYNSRLILIGESISTGIPLTHESHAGGTILFGSDGTLLLTTGDNASYNTTDTGSVSHTYYQQALNDGIMRPEENVGAFRSQMINSLCGKVLRLDPNTGDGITSNPHYNINNPRSAESRMYAMGLRNPFRASIKTNSGSLDPADANPGTLYVVDVGWGTWEDLHVIDKPGLNAGWPLYEGLTQLNSYYNSGTLNADESNQSFVSLCIQPSSFSDAPNPADRRYTHSRPSLAWMHGNTNITRVPWFNGSNPTDPRVGTPNSPTTGVEFRGNAGVAGTYIEGTDFGPNLTDKFIFSDYVRNWVGAATFNETNSPWISNVEEFAPINYGSGIVHMAQNPLDGSVFYSNIFVGEIRRFSYYDDTLNNESFQLNKIKIYPNPSKGDIVFSGINSEVTIEISSVTGHILYNKKTNESIVVSLPYQSGIYFAKITSNKDNTVIKKIIIE